jgi:hypothetical protein
MASAGSDDGSIGVGNRGGQSQRQHSREKDRGSHIDKAKKNLPGGLNLKKGLLLLVDC